MFVLQLGIDGNNSPTAPVRVDMRSIGVLLVMLTLVVAGCSRTTGPITRDGKGADAAAEERMIGVYSAIIRQLVTVDHTSGSGPSPFDRVFVLAGISGDAGDGMAVPPDTVQPFSPEVRAGIIEELGDLPPVEFVTNPDSVVVGKNRCARVKGNGALITLGPISGGKDKVTVPSDLFVACLGGLWVTYVLEAEDGGWQVAGTKGGIAIS